jgi:TonB-linked SusC/RagA family outer membrane protein
VSGLVTDLSGLPIPGVNVLAKGSKSGTQTDIDGKFKVNATAGQTLIFSFTGMKTIEASAANGMKVKMTDNSVQLEGVVVTALGIKRDKKSLGYSAQKLDAATINSAPTNNFLNNLSGKIAGLEVKSSGNFGGSTNIVLRGTKSITGNNQALLVVDGVPVNNANLNSKDTQRGRQGYDFGNSASDIDPNNIESITVLKGASATALYGSDASNGAIMITTKKGKKNSAMGISLNSTVSVGYIDKKTFPTYQKKYGEGYSGDNSSSTGNDIFGNNNATVSSNGDDASYGNIFDGSPVYQWNAFVPGNSNYGKATPWVAAKNDPTSFFKNSFSAVNSISINGGDEKSTFNLGITNNAETGVLPNSKLNRNILSGNFSRDLTDSFKVGAFLTFTDQGTIGRNSVGYGDNDITGFRQWWPANVDIKELESEYFRTGKNITWNQIDPVNGNLRPNFWNNPYFTRYENYTSDTRNRLITGANLSYNIRKNLNVLGRVTIDYSHDKQEQRKAVGSHAENFGVIPNGNASSGYDLYTKDFLQQTYDFITTYEPKITENIGAKLLGGYTYKRTGAEDFEGSTIGGLAAPGVYSLANSITFVAPIESNVRLQKSGLYGQASFDYKKLFFVEGTIRQDRSTALPTKSNKYNYVSFGSSLVFSDLIKSKWLNSGIIRGSYAEVGNDPVAGRLGSRINNALVNGQPILGNSDNFIDFENLKPEITKAYEVGISTSMFDNRFGFDVALYKSNSIDQIFSVPQSTSSGYNFSQLNAGNLENQGIEVSLNATPYKTKDFSWIVGLNWAKNKNKLISLNSGRDNLVLATFQVTSLNATVGESYGAIRGTDYVYDVNGNKTVDADGFYLQEKDKVLGNIQADWTAGFSNRFNYKSLSFNFLIDMKKGGSLYSLDQGYGQETGLYNETAGLNDLGNPVRNQAYTDAGDNTTPLLPNAGGVILPGVKEDGTPNDVRVEANTSGGTAFSTDTNPNKANVYDTSFVKLREVGLTFTLPSKYLQNSFLKSASCSLLGNNVWIMSKNVPYADPEAGTSSGNIQGYQSGVLPAIKVYSFNVKLNF